jgi:hypothetical protein
VKVGAWHQFGDRSQLLALEQMQNQVGVGAILSPRDLTRDLAVNYAQQYRALGAEILADPQFYIPESGVGKLGTHETAEFRQPVAALAKIGAATLTKLGNALITWNAALETSAVIAPAIIYEAGRPDIVDLNSRLFGEAKRAAAVNGVPVYATVTLGQSAIQSDLTVGEILAAATALDSDGWYFSFEFGEPRLPRSAVLIERFLSAGLTLACTGKPVMHAFAGPMALLSRCCGMTAAGIGHSQNLWQFSQDRWRAADGNGGGGAAPPRLFCPALCGTVVYEDEFALVSQKIRSQIYSASPFSAQIKVSPPFLPWSKWDANKHLVHSVCILAQSALAQSSILLACNLAIKHLQNAMSLHKQIAAEGVALTDNTDTYQAEWLKAVNNYVVNATQQIDFYNLI